MGFFTRSQRKFVYKEFEVQQGSRPDMWYEIRVYFKGKLVDAFIEPTMKKAEDAFEDAGYKSKEKINGV